MMLAQLRQSDPEKLFGILGQSGAETTARYEAGDDN
jgi:hypothetical protein